MGSGVSDYFGSTGPLWKINLYKDKVSGIHMEFKSNHCLLDGLGMMQLMSLLQDGGRDAAL